MIELIAEAEDSRSKEPHQTIQFWTNQDQNQYAIRLEGKSDLLATTIKVQYSKKYKTKLIPAKNGHSNAIIAN